MNGIIGFLTERRTFAVVIALLIAGGLGWFASRLGIDNSLESWFVEGDPALLSYQSFLEEFGNDEVVVIAIEGKNTVFSEDRLGRLLELSPALEAIDGIARVWSLATLDVPHAGGASLSIAPVLEAPITPDDVNELHQLTAQSRLASRLVSEDQNTMLIYAWLSHTSELEQVRGRILDEVRAEVADSLNAGERAHYGGFGVVYDALNRATLGEGTLFIGVSYLVVALALFLVTGRLLWTALALLTVTLADAVMFGAMGLLGRSVNMVSMALPALVLVLGVSNVLHMSAHLEAPSKKKRAFQVVLAAVAVPCLLNALTTAGGFLSLTSASMAITRDYGLFAALGVLAAFGFALVGMAALLPKAKVRPSLGIQRALAGVVEAFVRTSLKRRGLVLSVAVVVLVVSVWGVSRIGIDTNSIDFLPENDPVRSDNERLEALIGPYLPLELLLTVRDPGGWRNETFLAALSDATAALERHPEVGASNGVADVIYDLQAALDGVALEQVLPGITFKNTPLLAHLVSEDDRTLRLTASVPMSGAKTLTALSRDAKAVVQKALGDLASVQASGYLPLYSQIVDHLLGDQLTSFGWAFVVVFLLVGLVLRDLRLTLLAIPTNLLPVIIVLGVMGWSGIRLDVATVTIAAAVLGIVVDDTLHMLYGLKRSMAQGIPLAQAFKNIARSSGMAIVSTTVVFCLGFGVIALASVKSVAYVGLLMATAVFAALLVDLLLLPAIAFYLVKTD